MWNLLKKIFEPSEHGLLDFILAFALVFIIALLSTESVYAATISAVLISILLFFCVAASLPILRSWAHIALFNVLFTVTPFAIKYLMHDGSTISRRVNGVDIVINGELIFMGLLKIYAPIIFLGFLLYQIPKVRNIIACVLSGEKG